MGAESEVADGAPRSVDDGAVAAADAFVGELVERSGGLGVRPRQWGVAEPFVVFDRPFFGHQRGKVGTHVVGATARHIEVADHCEGGDGPPRDGDEGTGRRSWSSSASDGRRSVAAASRRSRGTRSPIGSVRAAMRWRRRRRRRATRCTGSRTAGRLLGARAGSWSRTRRAIRSSGRSAPAALEARRWPATGGRAAAARRPGRPLRHALLHAFGRSIC